MPDRNLPDRPLREPEPPAFKSAPLTPVPPHAPILPQALTRTPAPRTEPTVSQEITKEKSAETRLGETGPSQIHVREAPADVIVADLAQGIDACDLDPWLQKLAQLALHRQTQTPLTIGLLGPSGSGKSFTLNRLLNQIASLARAATSAAHTPFVKKSLAIKIDATHFGREAANGLANALHEGLARSHPALVSEALLSSQDPRVALREASEQLAIARRHLEAERRTLEDVDSRRARLTETVLYDTPGSLLENYIRRRRAAIERTLSRFGINGDLLRAYKDMVRSAAETNGLGAKLTLILHAFWSLEGQARRLVTSVLFLALGFGIGAAIEHQQLWLGGLRSNQASADTANWLAAHMGWFTIARQTAFAAGGLSFFLNLWHGWRYLTLVTHGRHLLQQDLLERRQDLDQFLAHQTRQVDVLAAEVEVLSRRVSEAEKRAGGRHKQALEAMPFANNKRAAEAHAFFQAVSQSLDKAAASGTSTDTPERILIFVDHFDSLQPDEARTSLTLLRWLLPPRFLLIAAFDPNLFGGDASHALDRLVQVPFQLGALTHRIDYSQWVQKLVGGEKPVSMPQTPVPPSMDPARSLFDAPLSKAEVERLGALAPLAGESPRAVKRFINLYRLLRRGGDDRALALMLALEAGGTMEDQETMHKALATYPPGMSAESALDGLKAAPRLRQAFLAAFSDGPPLSLAVLREAAHVARIFSLRMSPAPNQGSQ